MTDPLALLDLGLAVGVGLAAALVIWALFARLAENKALQRRIARLDAQAADPAPSAGRHLRRDAGDGQPGLLLRLAQATVEKFNLNRSRMARSLADRLAVAGLRGREAVPLFLFAKLAMPVVAAGVAAAMIEGTKAYALPPPWDWMTEAALFVAGYFAPDTFVTNMANRRLAKLRLALGEALDLMTICAEAGLSIDGTVARVAGEIAGNAPELAADFQALGTELKMLPDRTQAMNNFARRGGLAATQALATTLVQTERYGTPLAKALRVLAAEQRDDRMMRAEEKAARLPAVLTVPLILFVMPALFVVLVGPAVLRIADAL